MEVVAVVMVFLSKEQNQTNEHFSRPTVYRFGRLMSSALHFRYRDVHMAMTGCVSLGAAGGRELTLRHQHLVREQELKLRGQQD